MRKPLVDVSFFKDRRKALAPKIEGGALILAANRELIRNHDVHYPFRQESNFFYFTGFEEPDAIFVFRPGQKPETTMFVRPKDVHAETWDGFRFGVEGTQREYQIDQVFELSQLPTELPKLIKPVDKIYYRLGKNPFDQQLEKVLDEVRLSYGRSGRGLLPIVDPAEVMGELRVKKTDIELEWMRKAAAITCEAHTNAMKFAKPGVTERQVQAVVEYTFRMSGSPRNGYGSIVAAGKNATTLHYVFNDEVCKDGDLLLIDAGTEWNYYGADITRTFPVNGKFSGPQKDLYEGVLRVQKQMVSESRVGATFTSQQEKATSLLADVLIDLKVTKATKSELIEKQLIKKYYPHGLGHYLGLDVHDAGLYVKGNEPRPFESNMVITVEPGLYVPFDDDSANEAFRGIGIRIEDDIVIGTGEPEVLTAAVTKEVSEIEATVSH
ncbi:MAG: aminopeptidase P family protein [Bdellovibrionales bacterium]|nr:aminopeptidase P family protein [Bdellovibrionales bacterium]